MSNSNVWILFIYSYVIYIVLGEKGRYYGMVNRYGFGRRQPWLVWRYSLAFTWKERGKWYPSQGFNWVCLECYNFTILLDVYEFVRSGVQ